MSINITLEAQINELITIESNLKKSVNKQFLYKTLIDKKNISNKLYTEIKSILSSKLSELSEAKTKYYQELVEKSFMYISEELKKKLAQFKIPMKLKTLGKIIIILNTNLKRIRMATAAEIIKITSSLIPQYDGNGEKLSNVVSALTALKTVVTAATEPTAVQIILSKLEKKAKSAVGENPANIDAIKLALTQKCKQHISADVIMSKLNATRQSGALNKFSSEIEELTTQLETAYINDAIPIETATAMANKAGIKALAKGLKSQNIQTIIKAGTFASLHEAIGRAAENDNDTTPTAGMLYYNNSRGRGNYRGNSSRGHQQGRGGRYYQSNRQSNNQQWQGNNQQWRQNNYQQRNSNGRNSNWRSDQNQRNNDQYQQRQSNDQRNNQSRGRVYHASEDNDRQSRQTEDSRQRNNFLERAERVNQSSQ